MVGPSIAPAAEQLALICAHPELAGGSGRRHLTAASTGESKRVPGSTIAAPKNSRLRRLVSTTASASAFPS